MKLNKQLVIGDSIWKVIRKRTILHYGHEVWGLCDPSTQTILIKSGLSPRDTLDTIIHEALHALDDEYDIRMPHSMVHKLDSRLAQFLIDNFIGEI